MKTIYIGGTGRSGTTILRKLLSQHSQVVDVPEYRFPVDPHGIWEFYRDVDKMTIYEYSVRLKHLEELLYKCISTPVWYSQLSRLLRKFDHYSKFELLFPYSGVSLRKTFPNIDQHATIFLNNLKQGSYEGSWTGKPWLSNKVMHIPLEKNLLKNHIKELITALHHDALTNQNKTVYLEKNTWNILWFDQILDVFPDAKLIHIYRDPRDVVASFTQQNWMPTDPVQASLAYLHIMDQWFRVIEKISSSSYLLIKFEDLVNERKKNIEKIIEFTGISSEEKLLSFPMKEGNIGRWKTQFSERDLQKINEILAPTLKRLNYE